MVKIKLVIADTDEIYVNRLINFFSGSYNDELEMYSFTNMDTLNDFISNNKVDVLIATESFGINIKEIPEKIAFAYFSDSVSIDTISGVRTVCKYQKVDLIYKEILSLYSEKTTNVIGYKSENGEITKIHTFLSCSGGTGTSTVAAAYAINMARKEKKVLYLNFELLGSTNAFFNAEGLFNFSDVIYAIKSKKSNLILKLESTVKKDPTGVFFYDACKMPFDVMEMSKEDIKKLLDELKIAGIYDYIIIDTDFTLNKKMNLIIQYSNSLVFVSDGTEVAIAKFKMSYEALKVLEEEQKISLFSKISLIYNKFSSENGKYIDDESINVLGGTPRYKNATTVQIAQQISEMGIFNNIK
ncbi:AAA family ATPase [Clostridium lacusfryxellense]|uniref:AAA family ATPase n=1 Tax=Clostridium lacusfryxellense TaxID=205328 RepID=UPI001C0B45C4|nr:AAA family ATPase [Clostridium lacusfryxellense]MBU3112337.1 AAA family ATPase [Clostridium lacusfryxellense]